MRVPVAPDPTPASPHWPRPAGDLALPAVNFLSNGASGPGSWQGEAADLRSALAAIGPGSDACVAAVSGTLTFMPNYNLQVGLAGWPELGGLGGASPAPLGVSG
jgi:hypothetical protein